MELFSLSVFELVFTYLRPTPYNRTVQSTQATCALVSLPLHLCGYLGSRQPCDSQPPYLCLPTPIITPVSRSTHTFCLLSLGKKHLCKNGEMLGDKVNSTGKSTTWKKTLLPPTVKTPRRGLLRRGQCTDSPHLASILSLLDCKKAIGKVRKQTTPCLM